MNQQKAKMIRKQVVAMKIEDPKTEFRTYKLLKKQTTKKGPTPQKPASHSDSKRHAKESLDDFRLRRKKCNTKRRQREKSIRHPD